MPRDLDRERELTAHLPPSLNIFAEQRAGTADVRDHATRDFALEVREELADARNYLVWWMTRPGEPLRDDPYCSLVDALGLVAMAWQDIERATQIARPHRRALAAAIDETAGTFPRCRCPVHDRMTDDELVALGCGCTGPRFACPRLDMIRRRIL